MQKDDKNVKPAAEQAAATAATAAKELKDEELISVSGGTSGTLSRKVVVTSRDSYYSKKK